MTINLDALRDVTRLLFSFDLKPVQGDRFQPTGFPSLGAATYQTKDGPKLLVESAQSMANRFEATVWDSKSEQPVEVLKGISHVTVLSKDRHFLTDSMIEAHRLNSPYVLKSTIENQDPQRFIDTLKSEFGVTKSGQILRKQFALGILKYDIGCLLHGVFFAQKELAGGRLRIARSLSAFIEASGVRLVASGGVKTDHLNPGGDTAEGYGNVPFQRDEFTAEKITLHVNFDLAQVRGYGFDDTAQRLVILLGLYKLRKLIDGDLRLRTACDLEVVPQSSVITLPRDFILPILSDLEAELPQCIQSNQKFMVQMKVCYPKEIKEGNNARESDPGDELGEKQGSVNEGNGES